MKTKKCKVCGTEFVPRSTLNKYCGILCAQKHNKKKQTKKRAPSKTTLKKKADKIWKSVGKKGAVCEICKRLPEQRVEYKQLHAHHIVGRRNMTLRWDLRNRIWLCAYHHTLGPVSAHNSPRWFMEEFFKKYYPDDYKYLKEKEITLTHVSNDYLKECVERMKDESF